MPPEGRPQAQACVSRERPPGRKLLTLPFGRLRDWCREVEVSYTAETGEQSARYVGAGDARRIEFRSGTVGRLVAPGSATDGRYGLYRWDMPARAGGADPHFHRSFSEAFFVVAGTVALYDGTRWIESNVGDFVYVPEGGIHGFRNDSDDAASMLILFAPGAPREQYFEELAEIGWSGRSMTDEERTAFLARHDQYMI
ncbi:MAG TPA: cupin domain-containing protein [Candidatus Limnocylindrales bacterium]